MEACRPVDCREEGRGDPTRPAPTHGHSQGAGLPDALPASAARRPARPERRQPDRRAAACRAGRAPRPRAAARRHGGDPRLRRATHPGRLAASRRHLRPRTCSRTTRPGELREVRLRVEATIARRRPQPRLLRHRSSGRGQPQLPPLGHQVGRLLRGPRPDRPRRAPVGWGFRPIETSAPPDACSTPALRPPWPQATSRPPAGSPTSSIAALGGALPVPAQGQGTMNNLTLGSQDFTYYETLGGGQGACPGADGPSAIHVAMSNTLNTPVEALGGGIPAAGPGAGRSPRQRWRGSHRGGDGIVREIEALAPMRYTLITERGVTPSAARGRRRERRGATSSTGCDSAPRPRAPCSRETCSASRRRGAEAIVRNL